jgi:hypothetical protein
MKRTKRQHYVTQAYLKGFLEQGRDSLYMYGRNRDTCFAMKPDRIAFEGNYYSFKRPDGTWDDSLETFLADRVEGPGIGLLRRLAGRDTKLSIHERMQFALVLAFQEFRVPYMRQMHDAMFQRVLKGLQADLSSRGEEELRLRFVSRFRQTTSEFTVTPELIRDELQKLANDPTRFSRESLQASAFDFTQIYTYLRWEVHYANGASQFVTSDCPVMRVFPPGGDSSMSLMRPDVEIRFPLDKKSILVLRHDRESMQKVREMPRRAAEVFDEFERNPTIYEFDASDEFVSAANRLTIDFCHRWLFSSSERPEIPTLLRGPSLNIKSDVETTGEYIRLFGMHQS